MQEKNNEKKFPKVEKGNPIEEHVCKVAENEAEREDDPVLGPVNELLLVELQILPKLLLGLGSVNIRGLVARLQLRTLSIKLVTLLEDLEGLVGRVQEADGVADNRSPDPAHEEKEHQTGEKHEHDARRHVELDSYALNET